MAESDMFKISDDFVKSIDFASLTKEDKVKTIKQTADINNAKGEVDKLLKQIDKIFEDL